MIKKSLIDIEEYHKNIYIKNFFQRQKYCRAIEIFIVKLILTVNSLDKRKQMPTNINLIRF